MPLLLLPADDEALGKSWGLVVRGYNRDVDDSTGDILLRLNLVGWRTSMQGGPRFVVYVAAHRETGQTFVSRAPAGHAMDAVRYLARRCGLAPG